MGEDTEHEASAEEYAVVGVVGSCLYLLLGCFVLHVLRTSPAASNTRKSLFFRMMIAMCVFEIPRFFCIAVTQKYDWRSLYSLHIISGGLFFASFSIVCLQWSSLLKLGSYVKVLFTTNIIVVINVIFALFDLVAIIMCARESSLLDFFESLFFSFYIYGDVFKNIFFSLLLAFYGVRLIMKVYRYSTIELNERSNSSLIETKHSVFSTALSRLTVTLIISSLCFLTRLIMLILKSIALNSDDTVTSEKFPLFGFYWFCFSDFIPRVLPSVTFVFLMRTKRRKVKREMDSSLNSGRGGSGRFTYAGDDDDNDDDSFSDEGDYYNDADDDDDDETRSVSLFDPPPGSFIDDKDYAVTPSFNGVKYAGLSTTDTDNNLDNYSRNSGSINSVKRTLTDEDIAKERLRHERNTGNEMSLTSFRNFSGGGDL